jgi:hypothetical protein
MSDTFRIPTHSRVDVGLYGKWQPIRHWSFIQGKPSAYGCLFKIAHNSSSLMWFKARIANIPEQEDADESSHL